jgi:hypothetical protein
MEEKRLSGLLSEELLKLIGALNEPANILRILRCIAVGELLSSTACGEPNSPLSCSEASRSTFLLFFGLCETLSCVTCLLISPKHSPHRL